MRIALVQTMCPDVVAKRPSNHCSRVLSMIESIVHKADAALIPEYCFEGEDDLVEICNWTKGSGQFEILTAMLRVDDNGDARNQAIRFVDGGFEVIYNKIQGDSRAYCPDPSHNNQRAFLSQPQTCFISICNDRNEEDLWKMPPNVWLIPAFDSTAEYHLVPPLGYSGHIVFANGSPRAQRSSYHLHAPGHPIREVPKGADQILIVDISDT